MKKTRAIYMLIAAATAVAAVSCSGNDYEPGQNDIEGCPDVYFNAGQSGTFAFDLTEDIEIGLTVSRINKDESFAVPLEVSGPQGILDVTPLLFLEGEETAEVTVRVLAPIEVQKEYEFVISIPAPEYASIYGLNETSVTLSIIREDYVRIGSGTFYSELLESTTEDVAFEYSEILDSYRIVSPWMSDGNIIFHWDGKDKVTFDEDAMFYVAQIIAGNDGTVYSTYAQPEEAAYDAGTMTFTFNFWYAIPSEGEGMGFGYSEDTFKLDNLELTGYEN